MRIQVVVAAFTLAASTVFAQSPYSGLQTRSIKALSEQQVADLTAGRGMGLALAAELNGYPGPSHVLELADKLDLSAEQRARVQQLFASMKQEALVEADRARNRTRPAVCTPHRDTGQSEICDRSYCRHSRRTARNPPQISPNHSNIFDRESATAIFRDAWIRRPPSKPDATPPLDRRSPIMLTVLFDAVSLLPLRDDRPSWRYRFPRGLLSTRVHELTAQIKLDVERATFISPRLFQSFRIRDGSG